MQPNLIPMPLMPENRRRVPLALMLFGSLYYMLDVLVEDEEKSNGHFIIYSNSCKFSFRNDSNIASNLSVI